MGSEKNGVKVNKRSWQAVRHKSVEKIKSFRTILGKSRRKKNSDKKHHTKLLNGKVFHILVGKRLAFLTLLKDKTQKYRLCPLKNPKIEFFR